MDETRQELQSKLATAQHDLAKCQDRVIELEALLSEVQTNPSALPASEVYERTRALEEIRSLARFPSENANPVLRVSVDGTLLFANPGSHRLLVLWGCEVGTRLPEDIQQIISETFTTKTSTDVQVTCGEIDYSLSFVPLVDVGYTIVYGQDVTKRKETESAVKRYAQRMEILHQIDLGLIQGGSIQTLVERILKHLRQLIACQRADLMLLDHTSAEALVFAVGIDGDTTLGTGVRVPIPPNVFDGYDARHIKVFDDFRGLQDTQPRARQLVNEGLVCALSTLLMDQEHPIGVLGLFADTPGYFTAEHQDIATEIANQLSVAIRQMHLSEELAHHTSELEQKVTERTAELNRAKERVEAILNNSTDGIFLVHPDLKVQQANFSFNRLFACAPDEYFGKSVGSIVCAEDLERVNKTFQAAIAEQQGKRFELGARRKDGTLFAAELSIGHIKDGGLVCTIRDITEHKAQERQLRYQASLQQNVSDAVMVTDMEFRIQSWNRAAERIYGWRAEEVLGKVAYEILSSTVIGSDELERNKQQLLEQGWWQGELIHHDKEGNSHNILESFTVIKDESGVPLSIIAVNHDITVRKQIEIALQKSAAELHDLYNNAPCGYHSIDKDGMIVQINDTELRWLGYSRDELVGRRKITDIFTPESVSIFQQNFPLFKERGWVNDLELDVVRKDGTVTHILLNATATYDEDGHYLNSRTSTFDITELKRAQQAFVESESRYRLLAENVTDVIAKLGPGGIRTFNLSPSSKTVLGYEPKELLGPADFRNIHRDDGPVLQGLIKSLVEHPGRAAIVYRFLHKDGHYVWLESAGQAVVSEQTGEVTEFVFSARDITERKAAEDALRESEEKFRLLMDAAPVAIVLTNQVGLITLVNNQAETVFGYGRAELVGQSVDILLPDAALNQHAHYRAAYIAAPRVREMGSGLELFARRQDGTELPVEVELSYIETRAGLLVMSFIVDITERKQNATALEQQSSFLRSVIDISPNSIFVKDYDARFVLANRLVAQLYNTTVDDLIGKSDADFNPSSKEIGDFLAADRRVIDSGNPLFLEEPVTNFNGETRWLQTSKVPIVSLDGKSKYVLGVSTDITERKQAEIALREQHEFLQEVINNVPGLIMVKDRKRHFQLVNDLVAKIHDSTPADMLGKTDADFNPNQDEVNFFVQKDYEAFETGQSLFIPEETVMGRYYQTTKIPLKNRAGESDRLLVVATDITDRKNAEEALRQALEKEKELNELKSRFVSMASHEFRTPLATILALTETLSAYRQKMADKQIDERLDKIRSQVDHLKDIMDDVLQLARLQARRADFNPVRLDLDSLCRSVLDEFHSRSDVANRIEYTCNAVLSDVMLDKKLMRQIISNLVSNAVKYSPQDKPINVSLECIDDAIVLKVRDEGIGIPETDLVHLFQPFHRASNVGAISGTGLGLVITKESVELHGGTITVDSQVGLETTFTVNLPITTGRGQAHDENPAD